MEPIDIITKYPVFQKEADTIHHAVLILPGEGIDAAPVVDDNNRPPGIFSREVPVRVITVNLPSMSAVGELMTAPVFTPD